MQDRVFVYGTLRRGGTNHPLLRDARFLGDHWTEPDYRMLDVGPYPGVVRGGETPIRGEVYRVTPAQMRRLDDLEDYPRSYTRERITTPWGSAWMYLYRPGGQRLPEIASGDWLACSPLAGRGPGRRRA